MSKQPVLTLTQLHLDRLPGIAQSFSVSAEPGVNLVIGPNEAGKSSLARSVFRLLWPADPVAKPFSVRGEFVDDVGPLRARREGDETVDWTRKGDPTAAPTVPGGHVAHCYRLGLLDLNRRDSDAVDHELAREVQRQMAGGYDLSAVRELFPDRGRRLSGRAREWSQAQQDLQQCQNRQKQLAEQERQLSTQEADKQRALRATRRADQLVAAQTHHRLTARLTELANQLSELPPNIANVRADDHQTLADLQQRIADKSHQIQDLKKKIGEQRERLAAIGVAGDLTELAGVVNHATALATTAEESARTEAAALAAADEARMDLAPELLTASIPPESEKAFTLLAQAHRDLAESQARLEHLDILLDLAMVREVKDPESVAVSAEDLALLASDRLAPPKLLWLWSGALGLIGASLLIWWISNQPSGETTTTPFYLAGLVMALTSVANFGAWFRTRFVQRKTRRELERRCRAADTPLPAGWTTTEALAGFMTQAARTGEKGAGQRTRTELREELQRRRDDANRKLDEAAAHRRGLLQDLGQDEHRETLGLLHDLDRVARCRIALNKLEAERGVHRHNLSALAAAVGDGQARLTAMAVMTDASTVGLQAGLEKLRKRETEAANLNGIQTNDKAALSQAEHDLAGLMNSSDGLTARLAVSGVTGMAMLDQIAAMVAVLPTYQELMRARDTSRRDLDRIVEQLAADEELPPAADILALSPDELAERLVAERELAAGADELLEEMARVKERIETARNGDVWEVARARDAEKAADLGDLLDEQRLGILGNLLLDTVEKRHESDTQPPLLLEMNEHLALFTGGRFQLRVTGGGDDQRFEAIDPGQNRMPLTALSDGTRAQLLLAARLAFLSLSEEGLRAPLFLDEALTASDPVRFDAIAGAVGELAASTGRQVFYLTSNPADLAAWQRALANRNLPVAHEIDLASRRALAAAATAAELKLPALPIVPPPNGLTAAEYGARLQVPALRPWAHEDDVHLFYLWKDDLDLVHRLMVGGLPTLGQWRRLGAELVQAAMIGAESAARIDARGEIYRAFRDVWQVGRGKPVTAEDLAASEILSPQMMTKARRLLAKTGDDSKAFMAGVLDSKIKRLNQAKKDALQDFLEREGHLDNRPVWEPDQIVAHVLGAVSDSLIAGILTPDEVRRLVLDLHRIAGTDSSGLRDFHSA